MEPPRAVSCPRCEAGPGEGCRSPQGVTYASGYVHPEREVAAGWGEGTACPGCAEAHLTDQRAPGDAAPMTDGAAYVRA